MAAEGSRILFMEHREKQEENETVVFVSIERLQHAGHERLESY